MTAATSGDHGVAVDPSILSDVVGDDPELNRMLLLKFIEPSAALLDIETIHEAVAARSAQGVVDNAHNLKSAARAIGANPLADLCEALEKAGRAADWQRIEELHPHLDGVFDDVKAFIENV